MESNCNNIEEGINSLENQFAKIETNELRLDILEICSNIIGQLWNLASQNEEQATQWDNFRSSKVHFV
jgi:hypothetical protein